MFCDENDDLHFSWCLKIVLINVRFDGSNVLARVGDECVVKFVCALEVGGFSNGTSFRWFAVQCALNKIRRWERRERNSLLTSRKEKQRSRQRKGWGTRWLRFTHVQFVIVLNGDFDDDAGDDEGATETLDLPNCASVATLKPPKSFRYRSEHASRSQDKP